MIRSRDLVLGRKKRKTVVPLTGPSRQQLLRLDRVDRRTHDLDAIARRVEYFSRIGPKQRERVPPPHFKVAMTRWYTFCMNNIAGMRRIPLPTISRRSVKQSVIVESRNLPYLEFIIRNVILRTGSGWSHTLIATLENQEHMKAMAASISPDINVIVLPLHSLSVSGYNALLTSPTFWSMLHGEKILVYQHDSFLFRDGIDQYLAYDYVGAPWPRKQGLTRTGVGNGGLSVRSRRLMRGALLAFPWERWRDYSPYTKIWMKWKGLNGPEDIYFCRLFDRCIGILFPSFETARSFSTETIHHPDPIGGHQWWFSKYDWQAAIRRNLLKDFQAHGIELKGL